MVLEMTCVLLPGLLDMFFLRISLTDTHGGAVVQRDGGAVVESREHNEVMEVAKVKRLYPLRILMRLRQGCWSMHVVF